VILVAVVLLVVALAVVVLAVLLAAGTFGMRRRARHHAGPYLVQGCEGEFPDADSARAHAVQELTAERLAGPARIVVRRRDGGWDVVDEVHVLG
jgi:hypothetical protein